MGTSLVVQWLRLCVLNAGGVGLIPDQGTRILHAVSQNKIKKKKKNMIWRNKSNESDERYVISSNLKLLREVEEDTNKQRYTPFFIGWKTNIKISILSNFVYIFDAIPTKISSKIQLVFKIFIYLFTYLFDCTRC